VRLESCPPSSFRFPSKIGSVVIAGCALWRAVAKPPNEPTRAVRALRRVIGSLAAVDQICDIATSRSCEPDVKHVRRSSVRRSSCRSRAYLRSSAKIRRPVMMTRHPWMGAGALCLTLAACNGPAEPTAATPTADSFRAERFEVRVGEAVEKVNGASVTNTFFPGGEGPADARSSFSRRGISSRSHARDCDRGLPLAAAIRRRSSADRQDSKCQPAAMHYRWNTAEVVSVPSRRRTLDAAESVRVVSQIDYSQTPTWLQ
jgi:hypothetical protein